MKICSVKHKKLAKYESGKTLEQINRTLAGAGVDSICGGTIDDVMSSDGSKVYGERCNRCGKATVRCQVCGRMFANIGRHLKDGKGNQLPCYAGNREYRHMTAVDSLHAKIGALR